MSEQRQAFIDARRKLGVSERRACLVTGTARATMRYHGVERDDDVLRLELIQLVKQYDRYGYRMIVSYCVLRVVRLTTRKWNACDVKNGYNCLFVTRNERGSTTKTVLLFGCAQNTKITFGRWISCITRRAMGNHTRC